MGSAAEIRFSDVAHYVGLSVLHGQKPRKAAGSPPASHQVSQALASTTSTQQKGPSNPEAARIQQEEVGKLKVQMKVLNAAKRAESDQVKKLHMSMSDSALQLERARRRREGHEEKHRFHARRAFDVDNQIAKLREEMELRLACPAGFETQLAEERGSEEQIAPPPSDRHELGGPNRVRRRKSDFMTLASTQSFGTLLGSLHDPVDPGNTTRALKDSPAGEEEDEPAVAQREKGSRAKPRRSRSAGKEAEAPPKEGSAKVPPLQTDRAAPPAEADAATRPRPGSRPAAFPPGGPPSATSSVAPVKTKSPELLEALTKHPKDMSDDDRREVLRMHLIEKVGGAKAAFRFLDLSGSGRISPQEFEDGMRSLNINLKATVGLTKPRDAMKLFDYDRDMNIDFKDLFPEEADPFAPGKRLPTPDFCRVYGRASRSLCRASSWQPSSPEEEMETMFATMQKQEDAAKKRKWMAATLRRLKGKGKSDARCRELVAQHLPRGTGPKDRDGVPTFVGPDLAKLKQGYSDEVNVPIREATRYVADLKEQRKEQKRIYDKLYAVTEAELAWEKAQVNLAERSFVGKKDTGTKVRSTESIAQECSMEKPLVEDLQADFRKHAELTGELQHKAFPKFMAHLCPSRTLVESDTEAWWRQITEVGEPASRPGTFPSASAAASPEGLSLRRSKSEAVSEEGWAGGVLEPERKKEGKPLQKSCSFEKFALWYATSEARGPPEAPTGAPPPGVTRRSSLPASRLA